MKKHIELEFKTLLTEEKHQDLAQGFFKNGKIIKQNNLYYDTKDQDFLKRKEMLRLRTYNDIQLLTLKSPAPVGVLEKEIQVIDGKFDKYLKLLLKEHPLKNYKFILLSKSDTQRIEISDDLGTWCLDHSQFNNHQDYELEYELNDPIDMDEGKVRFTNFLQDNHIQYRVAKSKFLRSLNSNTL